MTVPTTFVAVTYSGAGTTGPFSVPYQFAQDSFLRVRKTNTSGTITTLALGTDYTVTGAGLPGGGDVTLTVALASGEVLEIDLGGALLTQSADYVNGGFVDYETLEDALDSRALADQWLQQQINRSLRFTNGAITDLPSVDDLKGRYLKFNSLTGAPEAGVFETGTSGRVDYTFSGDGATVAFSLISAVIAASIIDVYVSGIHQEPTSYSAVGSTLTFTEAPPTGTGNIFITVSETLPVGYTIADQVDYTQVGTGAVARTVQDRLREKVSIEDFGTLQQAVDTNRTVYFGPGTYTGSVTLPASMALEADATADLTGLTFTGSLRKGNRFTFGGDYEPTLGQLGHPAPNKGNSWQNALQVTRGTQTAPDSTNLYARTAAYIEMHTSKVHSASQSSWGNPYMTPALTVENQAHTTFQGALAGAAFRAYSTEVPAGATAPLASLVGIYAIGQTNAGAGNDNYSVWGANFIAAETTGNAAGGCVGIEVDLVHSNGATSGVGPSPGNNYTGYWAQSDAQGAYSTAAFYSSRTASSLGWNYHFYSTTAARNWAIYLVNPSAVTAASGVHIQTAAAAGTALEASTAGYNTTSGNGPNVMSLKSQASGVSQTQMVVTSNASNPVNIRVGGGLETVLVGAADSGGAGYRMLRVAN